MPQNNIAQVVQRLKRNKESHAGCVLVLGAGCSVTAGIPAADGIVADIKKRVPDAYEKASRDGPATYPNCMEALDPVDRRDLIEGYIANASINWTHIHIARLIAAGYVDRILTTNFDPLLVKACALFNLFPAVYDMAAIRDFHPQRIPTTGTAIFHLHGTSDGFFQAHDGDEVEDMRAKLKPLFTHCQDRSRTWIVVGYSGACDPVVDQLQEVKAFDRSLYWVGYRDQPITEPVDNLTSARGRHAHWMPGHTADSFFEHLATGVGCPPPPFLDRPFSHLKTTLAGIKGFLPDEPTDGRPVYTDKALLQIEQAIGCIEGHRVCRAEDGPPTPDDISPPEPQDSPSSVVEMARMRLMAQDWDGVVALADSLRSEDTPEARKMLATALFQQAYDATTDVEENPALSPTERAAFLKHASELYEASWSLNPTEPWTANNWGALLAVQARATENLDTKKQLWRLAAEKYQDALAIKSDYHQALNNWGALLADQARATEDADGKRELWRLAGEKYQAALAIKPDKHEALTNWGLLLADQAQATEDADSKWQLWRLAGEKYQAALAIKPDMPEALYNWGSLLDLQASTSEDADSKWQLWRLAGEKYQAALAIKPDMHEALFNWGVLLAVQAQATEDAGSKWQLWRLAGEKYQAALDIKPDHHQALNNWGALLADQGRATEDADGKRDLWRLAGEKYQAALDIKPDYHQALFNWGLLLADQARATEDADGKRELWRLAGEKYQAALAIKPDDHEVLANWGNLLADQARATEDADSKRQLWRLAGEKYQAALAIKPDAHQALNNWGLLLAQQGRATEDIDCKRKLWRLAGEKLQAALSIKPDYHGALFNWGILLDDQAQATEDADGKRELWRLAGEKYQAALAIKPDYHQALKNWGGLLVGRAGNTEGPERMDLLAQAEQLLLRLNQLAHGDGDYNLACVAALRSEQAACRRWLESARANGTLPTRQHLDQDTDMDSVRDCDWFKALRDQARDEDAPRI
ncbi:SIR2 family protein [Magnetospirillum sp. LM-5]|uniref:SIR2 family protein n=1 Tax=Magnetospirillum sp. LM-5 TaxID=2681466 RepID=UPI00156EA632|nr:SIR2 family protein [Magnetospirillum sp. LM-5]